MKSRKVFGVLQDIAVEAVPDTIDLRDDVRADIARRRAQRQRLSTWRNMIGLTTLVFTGLVLFAFRPAATMTTQPLQPSMTRLVLTTVTPLGKYRGMDSDSSRNLLSRSASTLESWPE